MPPRDGNRENPFSGMGRKRVLDELLLLRSLCMMVPPEEGDMAMTMRVQNSICDLFMEGVSLLDHATAQMMIRAYAEDMATWCDMKQSYCEAEVWGKTMEEKIDDSWNRAPLPDMECDMALEERGASASWAPGTFWVGVPGPEEAGGVPVDDRPAVQDVACAETGEGFLFLHDGLVRKVGGHVP